MPSIAAATEIKNLFARGRVPAADYTFAFTRGIGAAADDPPAVGTVKKRGQLVVMAADQPGTLFAGFRVPDARRARKLAPARRQGAAIRRVSHLRAGQLAEDLPFGHVPFFAIVVADQ